MGYFYSPDLVLAAVEIKIRRPPKTVTGRILPKAVRTSLRAESWTSLPDTQVFLHYENYSDFARFFYNAERDEAF